MSELTIPERAMPAVEILRRDVDRPTAALIKFEIANDTRRDYVPRFTCGRCPLGLHPTAMKATPTPGWFTTGSQLDAMDENVAAFYGWWDNLTLEQANEAVNLIWPQ